MFVPSSSQLSMLESRFLLPDVQRAWLEESWAEDFRTRILPLIDEEPFRNVFSADRGRPNSPIRLLIGLHLLKERSNLTDAETMENLRFNLLWQHALGVTPDEAHVSQRTMHAFRVRLTESDRLMTVFEGLILKMVAQEKLRVDHQRLDSTHVRSNIASVTRLTLFVETITHFLRDLERRSLARFERIEKGFTDQYLNREGYFSDVKRDEARRRLPVIAQHLCDIVMCYADDAEVASWDSYLLMKRLLEEQCDVVQPDAAPNAAENQGKATSSPDREEPTAEPGSDDSSAPTAGSPPSDTNAQEPSSPVSPPGSSGGPEAVAAPKAKASPKEPSEISGSSLQSPHDPDATYGHKGKGYSLQLVESCCRSNPFNLVLAFSLNGANESDQHAVTPTLDQLTKSGLVPKRLFADMGYGSGKNILKAEERGVDLAAPVRDPANRPVPRDLAPMREVEPNCGPSPDVANGPGAEEPTQISESTNSNAQDPENEKIAIGCADDAAESSAKPTDVANGSETATSRPARPPTKRDREEAAKKRRQEEQQQAPFKEDYKIRSGIESTNSQLKGRHGASRMRVRGRERMRGALALKILAMNSTRITKHHQQLRRVARRTAG